MKLLGRVLSEILNGLAPSLCAACDEPASGAFCEACGQNFQKPPERLVAGVPLLIAGAYAPPLSTAILRFKYQGRAELSRSLSRLVAPALGTLGLPADAVLVPVPLHPKRLATRGYNQAALLAQELGRSSGLSCRPRLLARARETERQVGKARDARLTNAADAFLVRQRGARHAVVVDDVVTTGATVRACAQALARGGIELCAVVALAEAFGD
ncbi:MAG: ComF family protein [Myxococcales bacterium]|nr:MAG: ComF family protein [Myxococcales bacterium]